MRSRKFLTFLLIIIVAFSITGCGNGQKIKELTSQADKYRQDGKLDDAITVYNKVLELEENEEIRVKLTDIQEEKESVAKALSFQTKLEEIVKYDLNNTEYISPPKLKEITDKLKVAFDDLESINIDAKTRIAGYTSEMKGKREYQSIKRFIESPLTDDAETMETLGFIDGGAYQLNKANSDLFINIYSAEIKEISLFKIPSFYK